MVLTAGALRRWAAALPAQFYDVRLVPEEGGQTQMRRCDAAGLVHATGWLRHMNAAGYHGYARPLDPRHVLVDDLCPDGLERLAAVHHIAAVVETSKANHQAWVTVSETAVEPVLGSAVARLLARQFGSDAGAASAGQVGRLPGLANRKHIHRRGDGSYPWTRLLRATPGVDPAGTALLAEAAAELWEASARRPSRPGRLWPGALLSEATPEAEWREAARRIEARLPPGVGLDRSRVDLAVARRLLARGASRDRVLAVTLAGPKASGLPGQEALRYAERTVRAALAARG